MQRLRVLIGLLVVSLAGPPSMLAAQAPAKPATAKPAAATSAAKPAGDAKPQKMDVGAVLEFSTGLEQVLPTRGEVSLMPRKGRPLAVLFWGRSSALGREALVELDAFVTAEGLAKSMDVYAVGPFKPDKMKADDLRDVAILDGVQSLPILADPGFGLSRLVGASQYPELAIFDKTGVLLIRSIRGLDHGRLGPQRNQRAKDLLREVAVKGSFPVQKRTFPAYAANRLIGRHYPDFEAPRFHAEGYGKGLTERLSDLLSGERPAVAMFFSSTCKHCQIDVPQIVEFLKKHPDAYDVVGITRIKDERHREVSVNYFRSVGLEIPILETVGKISEAWRVSSTPTSFYMSPAGRITKVTFYQHQDLEREWLELHPKLLGAPPPAPIRPDSGWHFPLKVKDEAGKVVDLADLADKPTILHFWATWCVPCREELPKLVRRLPELSASSNVLLISVDEEPDKVGAYQEKSGIRFPSYHSPHGELAEKINFARSVPRTYVLDEHGRLGRVLAGSYDWDDSDRYAGVLGRLRQDGN